MLKKLKLKFILINMIIVTIMLALIFGLLYYFTSQSLKLESLQMMKNIVSTPAKPWSPNKPHGSIRLPYFIICLDRDGNINETNNNFFDLSDKEELDSILSMTNDSKTENGVLKEYNLRFLRFETPLGFRIVFADMSNELTTLHNLVKTFSIVGSAAFLLFLAVSTFLAQWAIKPVEAAWQQQRQFVADASHELKTPLTVIMTDAELLCASDCPDEDRKPLSEAILTMVSQMRGLVENLLDLARIDSGNYKEKYSPISFSNIVSNTIMMFEPLFFEKELSLQYEIEPDIQINGIESHLKQLISIFLDNAEKYTIPKGKIIVSLKHLSHKSFLLTVSNQGDKISDADLTNIFKRFYRIDKARTMNHSYGLGLSIAQNIIVEHHGKIWVESEDGYNHFYAELPCI